MDYEDASLEAMSREELLKAAKHLRDRIRDGYNYLITDYRIKSAKTGEFVSFTDFIRKFGLILRSSAAAGTIQH
jgi:hypothetical protein